MYLPGKDIANKLYTLNEQVTMMPDMSYGEKGVGGGGSPWKEEVQRSVSFDNVHTGMKGLVRSTNWRTSSRASNCGSAGIFLTFIRGCSKVKNNPLLLTIFLK